MPPTHGGGGPRSGGEGGSQIWMQFLTCMHTMPPPARLKACHLPREWEALGMFAFQINFTHKQKFIVFFRKNKCRGLEKNPCAFFTEISNKLL